MRCGIVRVSAVSALLFLSAVPSFSGGLPVIRAMAGGGFTQVDFEEAGGYPDSTLEDWDQVNYAFSLQCLWQTAPNLRLGGEAGWEQLYYYYYRVPYVPSPLIYEANWSTIFIGGVAQLFITSSVYLIGGADLHFFIDDGSAFGVSGGLGAEIRISDKLSLPVEFRAKPVFGEGTPTVLQVNLGLAFSAGR